VRLAKQTISKDEIQQIQKKTNSIYRGKWKRYFHLATNIKYVYNHFTSLIITCFALTNVVDIESIQKLNDMLGMKTNMVKLQLSKLKKAEDMVKNKLEQTNTSGQNYSQPIVTVEGEIYSLEIQSI